MKKLTIFTKLRKQEKPTEDLLNRLETFFVQEREELVHALPLVGDDKGRLQRAIDRADEDLATLTQMKQQLKGAK